MKNVIIMFAAEKTNTSLEKNKEKVLFFIEEYAKNHNIDIKIIEDKDHFKEISSEYDRFLYIKENITLLPNSLNVFDAIPKEKIGVVKNDQTKEVISDVLVFSKDHVSLFEKKLYPSILNEVFLNSILKEYPEILQPLSYRFNRTPVLDQKTGEHRLSSYFVNYNSLTDQMPEEVLLKIMTDDLSDYKNNNYYKGYKVAVRVSGGFGDLVAAEPVVRYMSEELYKNDNLIIICHIPELFSHINRKIYLPEDCIPDASSYYVVDTLVGQSNPHPIHGLVSPILTHACNYASISCIRSELPLKNRQIKLSVNEEALSSVLKKINHPNLSDLVLVHLGISWPSKTIPEDVWNLYLQSIKEINKTPVLIGKDIQDDFRGVAKNINTEGCIDLRNNLTIPELVAVVSKIPVLISNDSFPVHVAGAFDNYIGLIATSKNPDYILPHRNNGNIYYKAKSLESKPLYKTYEARPNFIEGSRVDMVDEKLLRECLATPEMIKEFILDCFKNNSN